MPLSGEKKYASSFSQSCLIRYLSNLQVMSNLQVTRTGIKARMTLDLGQIGLFTLELFSPLCTDFFPHRHSSFLIRPSTKLLATRTGIKSQWGSNFSWTIMMALQLSILECQKISLYGIFVMQKPVLVSVSVPVVSTVSPNVAWISNYIFTLS